MVHTRGTQFLAQCLRKRADVRLSGLLGCCQASYDFALSMRCNLAVAGKGRQNLLVPEVLAPRLEVFGRFADIFAQAGKRISEAVRVEIRQSGTDEGLAKYRANGRGTAPVIPIQP